MGTTPINDMLSPDGKWDAVVTVRNGGAMTGYTTAISVVAASSIAREFSLFTTSRVFAADNNDGLIKSGTNGQIDVRVEWASNSLLVITYPSDARIFTRATKFGSINIRYLTAPPS
jgi:hypothetical protein